MHEIDPLAPPAAPSSPGPESTTVDPRPAAPAVAQTPQLAPPAALSPPVPQEVGAPAEEITQELLSNLDRVKDLIAQALVSKPEVVPPGRIQELERDNARLSGEVNDLYDQLDRLSGLYSATHNLHGTLDPEIVKRTLIEIAINLIGVETFVLMFKDDFGFEVVYVEGEATIRGQDESRYNGGEPMLDACLKDGRIRLRDDDHEDHDDDQGNFANSNPEAKTCELLAAVPLNFDGKPIGALAVCSLFSQKEQLGDEDRELFELIANHSATAFIAARAYHQAKQKLKTLESLMQLGSSDDDEETEAPRAFEGRLQDLPLPELVQFLHFGSRSGTLKISSDDNRGEVLFDKGNIIAARTDGAMLLSQRIVDTGIDEKSVEDIIALARGEKIAPGSLLVEEGLVEWGRLIGLIKEQIEAAVGTMLSWQQGEFAFRLGDLDTVGSVGVELEALREKLHLNTQMLLLDSVRKTDEDIHHGGSPGDNENQTGDGDGDGVGDGDGHGDGVGDGDSPGDNSGFNERKTSNRPITGVVTREGPASTEDVKTALNSDLLTSRVIDDAFRLMTTPSTSTGTAKSARRFSDRMRSAFIAMRESLNASNVAAHLMDAVASVADRAVLFGVEGKVMVPIGGFGTAMSGTELVSISGELEVDTSPVSRESDSPDSPEGSNASGSPTAEESGAQSSRTKRDSLSPLAAALITGDPKYSSFAECGLPEAFRKKIGTPTHDRVAMIPIVGAGQTILLVYADNGTVDGSMGRMDVLELLSLPMGLAFENEILRGRLKEES